MTKMSYLDTAQPCPQGSIGPLPVVGNPRSFSGLAAEGNRHLPRRERKSQGCCLVMPETGAKPASGQISVGAKELAVLRFSPVPFGPVRSWARGFLLCAKLAGLVRWLLSRCPESLSPMCHPVGSSLGREGATQESSDEL